jgi:ribosome-associated translation inhibitor RaiA
MRTPTQITYRGLQPSDSIDHNIQRRAEHLASFRPGVSGCHVTVELPHQHHHQGNHYRVQVELSVPGGPLVVTRGDTANPAYEDVHVVIRDAFDAALRRLEERRQKARAQRRRPDANLGADGVPESE